MPSHENQGWWPDKGTVLNARLKLAEVRHSKAASTSIAPRNKPSPSEADLEPSHTEAPYMDSESAPDSMPSLPIPAEPRYFPSQELSEKPAVVQDIPPDLGVTLKSGNPGYAILRLKINEAGSIDAVEVDESDLAEQDLSRIRQAFQAMQFLPGKIGESRVKTEMRIRVSVEEIRSINLNRPKDSARGAAGR
jgi:hypothetical protein